VGTPIQKVEDYVQVRLRADFDCSRSICDLCVRQYDVSKLYGPYCREDGFDCGYKKGTEISDRQLQTPWMEPLDGTVYLLTGELPDYAKKVRDR
jgi:hypothetical protein